MLPALTRTFGVIAFSLGAAVLPASAQGLGEKLLPSSTKGFISATNADDLKAHWQQTQVGQLMADPVMQPFVKDFRRQMQERLFDLRKKLGLTIEDLQNVPSGEVTLGVVESPRDARAVVVLMDVTGRLDEAKAMLEKATTNLTASGAKRLDDTFSGTPVIVLDIPDEEEQLPQEAVYFLKDNLLGAADDQEVMKGVLARLAGEGEKPLAEVDAFQVIMARAAEDAGESWTPQVRWFVEPIAYLELQEKAQPPEERPQGKTRLDIAKNQGMEAFRGIGGYVDLAVEGFELLHRTLVYAPRTESNPFEKSMKMLVFPNRSEFSPQPWVPREIANYNTMYGDVMNAFDNFGPLFDELFGEGETGVWPDVLDSLKTDPNGPQIDLRAELFGHLSERASMISDYVLPITPHSERQVFAIEAKDEKKVAAAIEKTLKDDEEIRRREYQGYVIWEAVPREPDEVPTISLGAVPPLGGREEDEYDEEEGEPFFPHAAVTAAHGQLLVGSHYDFLIKVLDKIDERETLAHDVEYRVVDALLKKIGAGEDCMRTFSRTDEELRATYELFRQGKMPEAETMLARLINAMLGVDDSGQLRTQQIDGSKLPDYDFVRRHLGPSGFWGRSEDNGWFGKGFLLGRESP